MNRNIIINLKVNGMHCHSCEMLIEDALSELKEIKHVKADSASGKVVIYIEESTNNKDLLQNNEIIDKIKNIIKKEGFGVYS